MKIIIVEDNIETLGVLRDFVRALSPNYAVKTYSSGNALLEQSSRVDADLLILGYDLGPSVTGTELLHYLEWSDRISAKTHVVFISNTLDHAKRQAPLRFTQTYFYSKPISAAHVEEIIKRVEANQRAFSSVFYLLDKKKWAPAFNSLQLIKDGTPHQFQQQAWLLECKILLQLRRFSKVLRRYQLVQSYDWARLVRMQALASLGQVKASQLVFNGMVARDPYYSACLALMNQVLIATNAENKGEIVDTLKESELSLFECEFRSMLAVQHGEWERALSFLQNKQRRAKLRSHQQYVFSLAIIKSLVLKLVLQPDASSVEEVDPYIQAALSQLYNLSISRDMELNETLLPEFIERMQRGELSDPRSTRITSGEPGNDQSPFSLMMRILNGWLNDGSLVLEQLEQCIHLIEQQGASGRASSNLLLFAALLNFTVSEEKSQIRLHDALGKRLFKSGKVDLAAYAFSRALQLMPDNAKLLSQLDTCMIKLEVKHFLSFSKSSTETEKKD